MFSLMYLTKHGPRFLAYALGFGLLVACSSKTKVDVTPASDGGTNGPNEDGSANEQRLPDCSAKSAQATNDGKSPDAVGVGRLDQSCILMDSTEVTGSQYQKFLDDVKSSSVGLGPAVCQGNNPLLLETGTVLVDNEPVTNVDWCDAASFCAWAGKRLCASYDLNGSVNSEFVSACTDGDHADFDYQSLANAKVCQGDGAANVVTVKSLTSCKTPTGVFDMVGNSSEWTNECDGDPFDKGCKVRGGSFNDTGQAWGCKAGKTLPRTHRSPNVGFRCCKD
jgi:formylglycine-generating enzyme